MAGMSPLQLIRAVFTLLLLPVLTVLVCLLTLVDLRWFRKSQVKALEFPSAWGRILCRTGNIRVRVEGERHLDPSQTYIFVANHCSMSDIWAFQGYMVHSFSWIAKKELFGIPLFGQTMRAVGFISIDRSRGRQAVKSLNDAAKRIAGGRSVLIFPEGTRSPDGHIQPFKTGAIVLAIKAGVQVVPVGFNGTHQALPKGSLLIRGGDVVLRIGQPLQTSEFKPKDKRILAETLQRQVTDLLDECHR